MPYRGCEAKVKEHQPPLFLKVVEICNVFFSLFLPLHSSFKHIDQPLPDCKALPKAAAMVRQIKQYVEKKGYTGGVPLPKGIGEMYSFEGEMKSQAHYNAFQPMCTY